MVPMFIQFSFGQMWIESALHSCSLWCTMWKFRYSPIQSDEAILTQNHKRFCWEKYHVSQNMWLNEWILKFIKWNFVDFNGYFRHVGSAIKSLKKKSFFFHFFFGGAASKNPSLFSADHNWSNPFKVRVNLDHFAWCDLAYFWPRHSIFWYMRHVSIQHFIHLAENAF